MGRHYNLFELGGHSNITMRLMAPHSHRRLRWEQSARRGPEVCRSFGVPPTLRLRRSAQTMRVSTSFLLKSGFSFIDSPVMMEPRRVKLAASRKSDVVDTRDASRTQPLHGPPRGSCLTVDKGGVGRVFSIRVRVLSQNGHDAIPNLPIVIVGNRTIAFYAAPLIRSR